MMIENNFSSTVGVNKEKEEIDITNINPNNNNNNKNSNGRNNKNHPSNTLPPKATTLIKENIDNDDDNHKKNISSKSLGTTSRIDNNNRDNRDKKCDVSINMKGNKNNSTLVGSGGNNNKTKENNDDDDYIHDDDNVLISKEKNQNKIIKFWYHPLIKDLSYNDKIQFITSKTNLSSNDIKNIVLNEAYNNDDDDNSSSNGKNRDAKKSHQQDRRQQKQGNQQQQQQQQDHRRNASWVPQQQHSGDIYHDYRNPIHNSHYTNYHSPPLPPNNYYDDHDDNDYVLNNINDETAAATIGSAAALITIGGMIGLTAAAAVRWLNGGDFVLFPSPTAAATSSSATTATSTLRNTTTACSFSSIPTNSPEKDVTSQNETYDDDNDDDDDDDDVDETVEDETEVIEMEDHYIIDNNDGSGHDSRKKLESFSNIVNYEAVFEAEKKKLLAKRAKEEAEDERGCESITTNGKKVMTVIEHHQKQQRQQKQQNNIVVDNDDDDNYNNYIGNGNELIRQEKQQKQHQGTASSSASLLLINEIQELTRIVQKNTLTQEKLIRKVMVGNDDYDSNDVTDRSMNILRRMNSSRVGSEQDDDEVDKDVNKSSASNGKQQQQQQLLLWLIWSQLIELRTDFVANKNINKESEQNQNQDNPKDDATLSTTTASSSDNAKLYEQLSSCINLIKEYILRTSNIDEVTSLLNNMTMAGSDHQQQTLTKIQQQSEEKEQEESNMQKKETKEENKDGSIKSNSLAAVAPNDKQEEQKSSTTITSEEEEQEANTAITEKCSEASAKTKTVPTLVETATLSSSSIDDTTLATTTTKGNSSHIEAISLHDAIRKLVMENVLTTTSNESSFKSGIQLLYLYTTNLSKNPNLPRYRKVYTNNDSFKNNIDKLHGGIDYLYSIGFTKPGEIETKNSTKKKKKKKSSNFLEWSPLIFLSSTDTTSEVTSGVNGSSIDDAIEILKEAALALDTIKNKSPNVRTDADKELLVKEAFAFLPMKSSLEEQTTAASKPSSAQSIPIISAVTCNSNHEQMKQKLSAVPSQGQETNQDAANYSDQTETHEEGNTRHKPCSKKEDNKSYDATKTGGSDDKPFALTPPRVKRTVEKSISNIDDDDSNDALTNNNKDDSPNKSVFLGDVAWYGDEMPHTYYNK